MSLDVEALYAAHYGDIKAYLRARLDDLAVADDLTDETWLRVIEHAGRYRDMGRPPKAWIYRIAHNLLVDHVRRVTQIRGAPSKRHPLRLTSLDEARGLSYTLRFEEIEDRASIRAALDTLPTKQRAVIVGRFWEGRPPGDLTHIASFHGVKKLQVRGLVNLRKMLGAA